MTNHRGLARTSAIALAFLLAACDSGPADPGAARVTFLLTDAPGDLATAEVEIREIYFQGGNDESGGRLVVYSGGGTFDLLQLRDGVTAELSQVLLPAGTYSQLRLRIGSARITTADGRTFSTEDGTLHCPSCAQSGLKIKLPGGGLRLEGGDQQVVVDFDVAQSFGRERGKSGRWVMHPTMTATRAELAGTIAGHVTLASGVTLPACGSSAVTLAAFVPTAVDGEVSLSGVTDPDGTYRFPFVPPGTYTLGYRQEIVYANGDRLTFAATPDQASVEVGSGAAVVVGYVVTSAACELAPPGN